MWRRTVLLVLIVLHKNISSQPLQDKNNNDRTIRQLDFGDSCSCEDLEKSTIRRDVRYNEPMNSGTEQKLFTRALDFDDCPCRLRESDSQGASSLLSPTAIRPAGSFMSPGQKKPIFNPEVDLASSVLETLRVVTDEEYQEALARDAAKSAARAAEDIMFEDASPQESANIVTIIVNPESTDDITPEASHIKQSRCIHPLQKSSPLGSRSRLYKANPWPRNVNDMDSDVGASSIDEHVMKFNKNKNDPTFFVQKKSKGFDLTPSNLLQSFRDKTIYTTSSVPKLKLLRENPKHKYDLSSEPSTVHEQMTDDVPHFRNNLKLESNKQNIRPLSLPNLLNLRDVELIPLRDLISKQIKKSKLKKSKSLLPSVFKHDDGDFSMENESKDINENRESTNLSIINDSIEDGTIGDTKSSSSIINLQVKPKYTIINDDCADTKDELLDDRESAKGEFDKLNETEQTTLINNNDDILLEENCQDTDGDTEYTRGAEVIDSDTNQIDDHESSPSHLNLEIALEPPVINENSEESESTEGLKDTEVKVIDNGLFPTKNLETLSEIEDVPLKELLNNNDCTEHEKNKVDLITDTSNTASNLIDIVRNQSLDNVTTKLNLINTKDESGDDVSKNIKKEHRTIENTISNIRNFIMKKQEDLNNLKASLNSKIKPKHESENIARNEDYLTDVSMEITTLEPEAYSDNIEEFAMPASNLGDNLEGSSTNSEQNIFNDNAKNFYKPTEISMQDLQKLSDTMLQREEIESKNKDNIKRLEEIQVTSLENKGDLNGLDLDDSPNTLTEVLVEPHNKEGKFNEVNDCKLKLGSQKNYNTQDSAMLVNSITKTSNINNLQPNLKSTVDLLRTPITHRDTSKMPSLNLFDLTDSIKDKFTSLFDKSETYSISENVLPNKMKSEAKDLNILNPANDENTSNYHSIPTSLKYSDELGLNHFPNSLLEAIVEPEDRHEFQDKSNEISTCKTDIAALQADADTQASENIVDIVPKTNDIFNLQSKLKPINLLKKPLKDISDTLKLTPLDSLHVIDNTKDKLTNLFNEIERDSENKFQSAVSNILNLVTTETSNFQSSEPLSKYSKNDVFELETPGSGVSNVPILSSQSDFFSNRAQSKSASAESYSMDNPLLISNDNNDSMNLRPNLDSRDKLLDTSVEATNQIYSTYKNAKKTVETQLKHLKTNNLFNLKNPTNLTPSLLDTLSRNQEDFNHKLRSLHMDFTDRVESLKNNMIDTSKLLASEHHSIKPNLKTLDNFIKQNYPNSVNDKLKALHLDFNDRVESIRNDIIDRTNPIRKESRTAKSNFRLPNNYNTEKKFNLPVIKNWQRSSKAEPKILSSRNKKPMRLNSSRKTLKQAEQKKLRMPTASSVPVPSTILVPELKSTSTKWPPLALRRGLPLTTDINGKSNKETLKDFGGEASTIPQRSAFIRNKVNLKKDNKIKVSFSTTPRPETLTANNLRSVTLQNLGASKGKFGARQKYKDHNGSPSELTESKIISNYDTPNIYIEKDNKLLSKPTILSKKDNQKAAKPLLHSWPKTTERAFLSKVKEAVQDRLSNVNSAKVLKQPQNLEEKAKDMAKLSVPISDMARSATENKQIMNVSSLKENVSYKCKMICSKE